MSCIVVHRVFSMIRDSTREIHLSEQLFHVGIRNPRVTRVVHRGDDVQKGCAWRVVSLGVSPFSILSRAIACQLTIRRSDIAFSSPLR
jgi:uncharacterized protein YdiU (UPF0061 family)